MRAATQVAIHRLKVLNKTCLEYTQMRCRQNSIAAKWNIFLSFGLKVPFGFPCFAHVCLESWLGLVFFSTAYVTLVVALLFGGLVLLLAFLQGFFNRFLSLRCSTVTLLEVGALACFYEWMDSVSDFATYA